MYFTRLGHHPGSVLIIFVPAVHTLYLLPKDLEQEFLTLPEHLRSPLVYSGVHVTRSLVVCVCFVDRCLYFFSRQLGCLFFFDIRILLTLPEHLRSPLVYSGVHVTRSLVVCVCFVDRCLYFFSRPLGCLFFFDIRILITTLISETLFITARSAILYIVMN